MNQDNIRVSVIMPCYNDGKYIAEAVASLRASVFQDMELIIIDDGSDDPETLNVLKNIDYPRVRILNTFRVRPAAARNAGIREARGEYIFPLDADDTIDPEYIGKAVEKMDADPSLGIVYCHADLFGEKTGPWELPDYSLRMMLLDNCIFVSSLFRKADWESIGGFGEDFRAGMEDYDFWLSVLGLGREVYQFPETWFHYRIKPASRTTQFNNSYDEVQQTYVRLYERHRDFLLAHADEYCQELRYQLVDQVLQNRRLKEEAGKGDEALRHEYEAKAEEAARELSRIRNDPMLNYFYSVREMKPALAGKIEKWLERKNRLKKLLGRKA